MRLLSGCVAMGIFGSTLISAQAPQAPGAIAGVVLDRNNSSPIRKAFVTLSTVEPKPQEALAWTDENGRFSFGYLAAGRYRLGVRKDGYQAAFFGAVPPHRTPKIIELAPGEVRTDFVFRLNTISSISGTVLDEDGDPVRFVNIMAMRPGFERHKRTLLQGQSAMTDEKGHYRISNLVPGKYALFASVMRREFPRIQPEVSAGERRNVVLLGSQYYPGTDRADAAALLTLEPGQELAQIDFHIPARPAVTVAGKAVLPTGVPIDNLSIMAVSAGQRMQMGTSAHGPDFAFRLEQLSPGDYHIIVEATIAGRRYRGVQFLSVRPEGVNDLIISVEAPVDLSGSLIVEGPDAAQHPVSSVTLTPGDGIPWNGAQLRANINKDGTFKITGVPPGVWDIGTDLIRGGYIKSMRLGDQDVLTEDMVIRSSTTAKLKIVLGTKAALIEGDVTQGDAPVHATVLVAPVEKYRHVTSFYRPISSDDKGHFKMAGIRPGEYKLFAFEDFDPQSIQDPDFLKPFESKGVPVTLREGENEKQKLSLIRVNGGNP
jgi:hypothetical protein